MNGRIEMPDINFNEICSDIGAGISRGGRAFWHVIKDATVVNANIYDTHGTPERSSWTDGCEFYDNTRDSSGDLFALGLVSVIGGFLYFPYRVVKDSCLTLARQSNKAVNDVYLSQNNLVFLLSWLPQVFICKKPCNIHL